MTKTMIPDGPEPGDNNHWFKPMPDGFQSMTGGLDVDQLQTAQPAVAFEPRLVVSPSAPPLPKRTPKRSVPKHRSGRPAAELLGTSLAPTAADLRQVRTTVGELDALVDDAMNLSVSEAAQRLARSDDAVRGDRAALAARRVAKGHLSYDEREALAGVLAAYAMVPSTEVLPVPLLATLEAAVAVLSASRADQQLGADTDVETTAAQGQGGVR